MGSGRLLPWVYVISPGVHNMVIECDNSAGYAITKDIKVSKEFLAGHFYVMRYEMQNNAPVVFIDDETDSTDTELVALKENAKKKLK
jgi:hypothetical protein